MDAHVLHLSKVSDDRKQQKNSLIRMLHEVRLLGQLLLIYVLIPVA